MGMKKLIFDFNNFFGSGHEILKTYHKRDGVKSNRFEKLVFSNLLTMQRNFENWLVSLKVFFSRASISETFTS